MQNIRLNKSKIIKYTCFITNVTTLVAKTWKWEDYVKTKQKPYSGMARRVKLLENCTFGVHNRQV